jgi:WD40 repeat protein
MNLINFEFIFNFILPQVLLATIFSVVIALIVGSIVGFIVGKIAHRKKNSIIPAILGSAIGTMLLGMIPIFADPSTYGGGVFTGLAIFMKVITLIPAGSILGGVVGSICGLKLSSHLKPRLSIIGFVVTYIIMVLSLYLNLAPLPFQFVKSTGQERDILPTIGKIIGYKQKFSSFYKGIRCLAFTNDGKKLVVVNSGDIRVWQIDSGELLHTFPGPPDGSQTLKDIIDAIAISPDNKTLATAAPEEIQIRELETGNTITRLEGSSYVKFSADGKYLIGFQRTDKANMNVGIWEISSGKLLYTIPSQIDSSTKYTAVDIIPDNKTLVITPRRDINQIELWQLNTGKKLGSFGGETPNPITDLAVTPDGKTLITAQNANLQIWDLKTKKVLRTIPNVREVKDLLVSPDNQTLVSNGNTLNVWQLSTGKQLVTRRNEKEFLFSKVALSPDGKILAASDEEGVRLWKLVISP